MSQNGQSDGDSTNVFLRLWRGQLSLPVAYWGFGVVGKVILVAAGQAINPSSTMERFLVVACLVAYSICVSVGIWRAADRYIGERTWVYLAKLAVMANIASTIRTILLFDWRQ